MEQAKVWRTHLGPPPTPTLNHHLRADEDKGLDMHTDDSDVTLNICLGREGFEASGLTFCGKMGKPDHRHFSHQYRHEIGRAVVHLGQQRHGADDITTGERNNLIIWNHNLGYRQVGASVPNISSVQVVVASLA